jgi:hypothetical protein
VIQALDGTIRTRQLEQRLQALPRLGEGWRFRPAVRGLLRRKRGTQNQAIGRSKGGRASIFEPGSNRALPDSPFNLEKSRSEEIVAEARRVIDARLAT